MKLILAVLFLLCAVSSFAQPEKEGKSHFTNGNYAAALEKFEQVLKADPNNQYVRQLAGESILQINGDPSKALSYLKEVVASGNYRKNALHLLAEAYAQNYQFDMAIDYYSHYLKTVSKKLSPDVRKRIIDCQTAKELVNYPIDAEFTHLGELVNSGEPDYNPYVTADESLLYFSSRRSTGGAEKEYDGFYPANIYVSELQDGAYGAAKALSGNVNSKYDDVLVGMMHDGSELIIYYDDVDFYGDLFTATKSSRTFSRKSEMVGINNANDMETAATYSPDRNTIIFASDRPGGMGSIDLYIKRKLPDGSWSEAQNLGPEVNTPMREDAPNFSADGRHLYFASDGHPGMGELDLFFTEWNPENNIWTLPKNLGHPVNTPRNDRNISFNEDGSSAYVASWRPDSHGDLDIYRIDFGQKRRLPALVRIQTPTGNPEMPFVNAQITVTDENDELVGTYRPHPTSGKYVMALNPGKYFLFMDADGHKPYSELMVISDYYSRADQSVKVIRLESVR